MDKKEKRKVRRAEFEIDIESLISAPLKAISKANDEMLTGQTKFLLKQCFTLNDEGFYEPVMVNLVINKSIVKIIDNEEVYELINSIIAVPLLSIISINAISVEEAIVDFAIEITSMSSISNSDTTLEKNVKLKGKIESEKNTLSKMESNVKKNMSIHIKTNTLPLPLGILNILDVYNKNIAPIK